VRNKYRILEERPDGQKVLVGEFPTVAVLLGRLDRIVEGSRSRFFVMIAASNKVLFRAQGSHFQSAERAVASS